MSRTTLIYTTIASPALAERFLASIRRHHPELPVIIGEQAAEPQLARLCDAHGAKHLELPFDCGVAAARNALVRATDTEFFLLAEDDMVVEKPLPLTLAENFLRAHCEHLCVIGALDDYDADGKPRSVPRIHSLLLDQTGGGLVRMPVELVASEQLSFDGAAFIPCDYGPNWGVFRRAAISAYDLWWDEQFKISGEHIDFFLRAKAAGAKVVHLPALVCGHYQQRSPDYLRLRKRTDWIEPFAAKWQLRYFYAVGDGLRFYADYQRSVPVGLSDRRRIEALERQNMSLRGQRETLIARLRALRERAK